MSKDSPTPNGQSAAGAFAELRGLLLAPEQEDLRQLRQSIEAAQSAEQLSRSLPEAVRLAAQRDWKLEAALRPVVEHSVRLSVRHNPGALAGALSPLIADIVKRAVVSALRQLAESIQETIEQGFSLRSLGWRLEAARSGRPYSEILLLHSLLYRVDRVYLIHGETGLLLAQASAEPGGEADGGLVSAMLTAIQDFVKDSFGAPGANAVEIIEAGEFVIWTQQSSQVLLAALIRGVPPKALKSVFEAALERICRSHSAAIANFDGDVGPFRSCHPELAACLLGRGESARRNVWPWLWALAAALILAIGALAAWQWNEARKWQGFVDALRREPGVVVTDASRRGGRYFISGLRDPLARDPALMLRTTDFAAKDVEFDWQSYLSMQPSFVKIREFADAKKRVEARRIHFAADRADLSPGQMDAIQDTAQEIKELLARSAQVGKSVNIEVVGSADNSGTGEHNVKLSGQRAAEVAAALISAGVPSPKLHPAEAAKAGNDDRSSPFSRNVSFRVPSN
jgi:OOP family OmpA-OmpF porin